jgi:hypothetical protein
MRQPISNIDDADGNDQTKTKGECFSLGLARDINIM